MVHVINKLLLHFDCAVLVYGLFNGIPKSFAMARGLDCIESGFDIPMCVVIRVESRVVGCKSASPAGNHVEICVFRLSGLWYHQWEERSEGEQQDEVDGRDEK
jgi:hypothetical protein